ncbi:hypothetical protein MD484_g8937, partial [Candolleomyces efflorescens]
MNDTLLAGQDYVAKWSAPGTPTHPSFLLCLEAPEVTSANGTAAANCGDSAYVPLQQAQGMFFVSLAIPNITSSNPFFLRMHDETGPDFDSPPFFIQLPVTQEAPDPANSTSTNVPDSASDSTPPGLVFQLHNATQGQGPSHLDIPALVKREDEFKFPFSVNEPMLTTLAIIPVLMVAAGLAIAVFFWFRQRRNAQLKRLYLAEGRMIYPRRPSPKTLNSAEDIESAVQSLSKARLTGMMPHEEKVGHLSLHEGFDVASTKQRSTLRHKKGPSKRRRQLGDMEDGWKNPSEIPLPSSSDWDPSNASRTSYVPEPRSLTDSYFPPVTSTPKGPRNQPATPGNVLVESPIGMEGLSGQVHSTTSVAIAAASPPPPSVTKLSERLHLRTRSNSTSAPRGFGQAAVAG